MGKHYNFIKKAYNGELGLTMPQQWKDKILENYPEFKEEDFKPGEWVVVLKSDVFYYNSEKCPQRYMEELEGGLHQIKFSDGSIKAYRRLRKATKGEITEHLIREAERRGLTDKNLPYIKCLMGYGFKERERKSKYVYEDRHDKLWLVGGSYLDTCIYHEGKWAEKIDIMTKSEAEQRLNELGVNVKIID